MCLISTRHPRDRLLISVWNFRDSFCFGASLDSFFTLASKRRFFHSAVMYYFFIAILATNFFVPPLRGFIFASQRQILFSSVTACLIPNLPSQRQIILKFSCINLPLNTISIFLFYLGIPETAPFDHHMSHFYFGIPKTNFLGAIVAILESQRQVPLMPMCLLPAKVSQRQIPLNACPKIRLLPTCLMPI